MGFFSLFPTVHTYLQVQLNGWEVSCSFCILGSWSKSLQVRYNSARPLTVDHAGSHSSLFTEPATSSSNFQSLYHSGWCDSCEFSTHCSTSPSAHFLLSRRIPGWLCVTLLFSGSDLTSHWYVQGWLCIASSIFQSIIKIISNLWLARWARSRTLRNGWSLRPVSSCFMSRSLTPVRIAFHAWMVESAQSSIIMLCLSKFPQDGCQPWSEMVHLLKVSLFCSFLVHLSCH